ncbi:hypothetical protein Dxin01_00114 [Deinococcus xinjiangensis]|uniref:DNA primase small subunit n=1 Tax=Deinococcus xinjiangensis TaxID=457454 RepID=A0ABP9VAV7_9DEIO
MIERLPSYPVHEYGSATEAGWYCPICRTGRLVIAVPHPDPEPDELACPECASVFLSGWRRNVWAEQPPATLRGTPVSKLGSFFESIQAYMVPPRLAETALEEPLGYLADFVVDIDRADPEVSRADAKTVYEYLDDLAPGQVRLYFSGGKGYHLVLPWQALGSVPSSTLNEREYRQLASLISRETGVMPDYKIYSPARMLRMPDSWHPKTGLYKVEITIEELPDAEYHAGMPRGPVNLTPPSFSPAAAQLFERACVRAKEMQKFDSEPTFKYESFGGAEPPCIARVLKSGLPYQGSRHAMYLMLARYWKSAGIPIEQARTRGREFAEREDQHANTPKALRVRDMLEVVRYIYAGASGFSCVGPKSVGLCHPSCQIRKIEEYPLAQMMVMNGIMN